MKNVILGGISLPPILHRGLSCLLYCTANYAKYFGRCPDALCCIHVVHSFFINAVTCSVDVNVLHFS